jgi:hypothetical protein
MARAKICEMTISIKKGIKILMRGGQRKMEKNIMAIKTM